MRYIDGETVDRVSDFASLVSYLEEAHRGPRPVRDDMLIEDPQEGSKDIFFNRAAWLPGVAVGIKVITVFPDNPNKTPALPNIQAVYVLMDGKTGTPQAAIDGTKITYWKTAADSALGTKQLARDDAETLLMVGAGAMAGPLIRAHTSVRPSLKRVLLWNRSEERAQALISALSSDGITAEYVADLDGSVGTADVISCATMTKTPIIKGDLLKSGVHLDLVGAFKPDMREADDTALALGRMFVDTRETALDTGEISIPIENGTFSADQMLGDHYELAQGAVEGRINPDDITIFKNGGGGHLDLMTARYIYSRVEG